VNNHKRLQEMMPFFSVLMLIATLFSMVLLKMEVRRVGYSVLKSTQEYRKLKDQYRHMQMEYAALTRPDVVRRYAVSRLTLNDARNGQIIQLTGQKLAVPQ
jgi:cell division protein FtsL